ncbi:MAG TPA: nuclear transport factor 2 family protein [Rhodothermales bacterium]|nr:nuclear transport factor 2 family protein [Rhodothermales bacterium]
MSEQNKAHARSLVDAWSRHNPDALDDILASDYVSHDPPLQVLDAAKHPR